MENKIYIENYIEVETQINIPIYSEHFHNINGEWLSVDDIDTKNIGWRKVPINKINDFIDSSKKNYHYDFKNDYCIMVLNGQHIPIHGKAKDWIKRIEKCKRINSDIYSKLNKELSKISQICKYEEII